MKFALGLLILIAACATRADSIDTAGPAAGRLPAWIIELPESVTDVLVADTGNATMHRFSHDGTAVAWQDSRYMSIGQNGVRKSRAWDKKTPLGAYFVTERLNTERMHDKYGVAAFPLDYPNAWDRYNSRTGYGIWLHGVDKNNPARPPLDTDGCLAIPNDALTQIADKLEPLVTPVIVVPRLKWTNEAEIANTRTQLRIAIDQWRESLSNGDLSTYLSLYSDNFRRHDMDKSGWSSFRLQVFRQQRIRKVDVSAVLLLAEPADENLFLSRFTQIMTTESETITTTKRLYWQRMDGNRWQIISEDTG